MKFFLVFYCSFLILPAGPLDLVNGQVSYSQNTGPGHYIWKQVVKPGNGRFQENWTTGTWPMALMPVIAFENKLWITGEKNSWSSGDGTNWLAHAKTNWGNRYGEAYVLDQ